MSTPSSFTYPQVSAPGPAARALASEIAAAVSEDEESGVCDIAAGMFGPNFSELIRRLSDRHAAFLAAENRDWHRGHAESCFLAESEDLTRPPASSGQRKLLIEAWNNRASVNTPTA